MLVTSALAAGLAIGPFLGVEGQPGPTGAWDGFEARGSVLFVLVVRKGKPASCSRWARAVGDYGRKGLGGSTLEDPPAEESGAWKSWDPWREEDLEAVSECDDMPCDVKLGEAETAAMAARSEEGRKEEWVRLIAARTDRFWRTGKREATEFEGDPADPWAALGAFLSAGGSVPPARGGQAVQRRLHVRRLDFAIGKMRPLRQTLESLSRATDRSSSVWVRDAYTAHYFDSWGEWLQVVCEGEMATGAQALVVDLDLLKKGDILSRLARPRMRSSVRESGLQYLNQQWRVLEEFLDSVQVDAPVLPRARPARTHL